MARSLSKVSDVEGHEGVAGQVVDRGCLTLGAVVYLQKQKRLSDMNRIMTQKAVVVIRL